MRCYAWIRTDIVPDLSTTDGVPPSAGLTAADVESAYKLGITKGAGQTVAIVDAFGYTQAASDLAAYRSGNGLPACTTKTGCLTILNQKGQKKLLPKPNPGDDWRPEQALDLDAVSAACPKCHIVLVQATSDYDSDLQAARCEPRPITRTSSRTRSAVPKTGGPTNPAYDYPNTMIVASAGDDGGGTSTGGAAMPCALRDRRLRWRERRSRKAAERARMERGCVERPQERGMQWLEDGATGSGCSKIVAKPMWQTDTANDDSRSVPSRTSRRLRRHFHPFAISRLDARAVETALSGSIAG